MKVRLGISPCPNDTFAFHGLLAGEVDLRGLELEVELCDVQVLNERLEQGELDAGKASFHAALRLADRYGVLPVGSALGFGVGPLLLGRRGTSLTAASNALCPGADTTATLLLRSFHPEVTRIEQVHFAEIMPALARGDADCGVVIHEGRFTYHQYGLHVLEDLGERWESETGCPLPLGGLIARLDLDPGVVRNLTCVVQESLYLGLRNRDQALESMRRHAQEMSDSVLWQHVDLYVNEATRDLGEKGREALRRLGALARQRGILPETCAPIAFL